MAPTAIIVPLVLLGLCVLTCLSGPAPTPEKVCLDEAKNSSSCEAFHTCCERECGGQNFSASCKEEKKILKATCKCKGGSSSGSAPQCGKPKVTPKGSGPKPGRIVGGEESNEHSWPWQVSLHVSGEHHCGGSLLDAKHVLTAAHCVDGQSAGNFKVLVGLHDQEAPASSYKIHKVEKIIKHAGWDPQIITNDIAIMRLATPVEFNNNVSPVCLPEKEVASGKTCITTGWGRTKGTGDQNKLLQVAVPVVGRSVCNDTEHHNGRIDETMLCAGQTGKGVCHGDSGGPLVCQRADNIWELQGATSWGNPDCTEDNKPGVYNRVFAFKKWINDNMKA